MTNGGRWGLGAAGGAVLLGLIWWLVGQGGEPAVPEGTAPEAAASETTATEPTPEVVAEPAPTPAPTPEPAPVPAVVPPRFDVLRVDGDGLATIAGEAPAGATVSFRLDGTEVGQATADATGQFAALLTLSPSDKPRLMGLVAVLPDGKEIAGVETVAIAPIKAPVVAEVAPTPEPDSVPALLLGEDGVKVLSEPAPLPGAPVQVDSITYGAAGEVVLAGRASAGATLRLYLDDAAMADAKADAAGDWQIMLPEVPPGFHKLRADEVDAAGKVISRYETPFHRDIPEVAAPAAEPEAVAAEPAPEPEPAPITITVQPGLTLWAIARENFGDGMMYVQVFEANRDKIKDPDLIYPGQVFTVPKP